MSTVFSGLKDDILFALTLEPHKFSANRSHLEISSAETEKKNPYLLWLGKGKTCTVVAPL